MTTRIQKIIIDNNLESEIAHFDMRFIKPMDLNILKLVFQNYNQIITIEDGIINGGFGHSILLKAELHNYKGSVEILGIPNQFLEHGTTEELHDICGLSELKVTKKIKYFIKKY